MSWKKAYREAELWIEELNLGKVRGRPIDLHDKGGTLAAEGIYRKMILEAARRIITKRGATEIILPL